MIYNWKYIDVFQVNNLNIIENLKSYINIYLYKYNMNISKITKCVYKDYHLISRLRLFINFL